MRGLLLAIIFTVKFALPAKGERSTVLTPSSCEKYNDNTTTEGRKKMRRRRYRGVDSWGMFCSLAELGWDPSGPDEVALLRPELEPGQPLDCVDWRTVVREPCERAQVVRQHHAVLHVGDRRLILPLSDPARSLV